MAERAEQLAESRLRKMILLSRILRIENRTRRVAPLTTCWTLRLTSSTRERTVRSGLLENESEVEIKFRSSFLATTVSDVDKQH